MAFNLPPFLAKTGVKVVQYNRWLYRKAVAHYKRDIKRSGNSISRKDYRERIHEAVLKSNGRDYYTGKKLDWRKISKYRNDFASRDKISYLKKFNDLPTIDHESMGKKKFEIRICGWLTNDCKSRLTHKELLEFCKSILENAKIQ